MKGALSHAEPEGIGWGRSVDLRGANIDTSLTSFYPHIKPVLLHWHMRGGKKKKRKRKGGYKRLSHLLLKSGGPGPQTTVFKSQMVASPFLLAPDSAGVCFFSLSLEVPPLKGVGQEGISKKK